MTRVNRKNCFYLLSFSHSPAAVTIPFNTCLVRHRVVNIKNLPSIASNVEVCHVLHILPSLLLLVVFPGDAYYYLTYKR